VPNIQEQKNHKIRMHPHPTPRSGRKVSLRRGLEKRGTVACASSRLGETSSPERDGLSLKIGVRRLSDSSCNT